MLCPSLSLSLSALSLSLSLSREERALSHSLTESQRLVFVFFVLSLYISLRTSHCSLSWRALSQRNCKRVSLSFSLSDKVSELSPSQREHALSYSHRERKRSLSLRQRDGALFLGVTLSFSLSDSVTELSLFLKDTERFGILSLRGRVFSISLSHAESKLSLSS